MADSGDHVDNHRRNAALRLTPVSRETEERLATLVDELRRWQAAKNLVSPTTIDEVWMRHVADSLQVFAVRPLARRWLDLGSGGGFPGLVIAAQLAETGGSIDLVESNGRKCAFLRHAARKMGVPARVHQARIEDVCHRFAGQVDVVTARALASLTQLLAWTNPLLRSGTVGIFPKGQHLADELTDSAKCWRIQSSQIVSATDPTARILIVTGAENRVEQ